MKQSIKIVISLAVIIGLATLVISGRSSKKSSTTPQSAPVSSSAVTTATTKLGAYAAYDQQVVGSTTGTRLLFFHAPWCPQCRALEASIKAGIIPENVTIFKVDYDSNQALRQKYGVTIQTTLVKLDSSGELSKKYVAYQEPNLDAVINNLIK